MKETLKLGDIASAHEALTKISASKGPLSFAILVKRNLQIIRPIAEAFHEARQEVFNKFGTEKDGQIVVPNSKAKAFGEAVKKLVEETTEVEGLQHFTLTDLEELEGKVEFSGQDLIDLDCLMDD